jgi:hypothetical protein
MTNRNRFATLETEFPIMALVLSEEQSMLRDSARGLISDKAPVSHLRQLRDAKDATGFSRDLWKTFAEMGFPVCWCRRNSAAAGSAASRPAS